MGFEEAFQAMGYKVVSPRNDWSAEADHGVCLTLWTQETDWKSLVMDTRVHAGKLEKWGHKPGNKRRIGHAARALRDFGGWVDIVKIDGTPGVGYGDANPWKPSDREGRVWKIVYLDEATGHLRLEAHLRQL